jgi:hypothetical protein
MSGNNMETDYKKQAEDFLKETNTELYITKAEPQTTPLWSKKGEKHGIDYSVRLKNNKNCYDFHFWGSISDAEKISHGEWRGTKPDAYAILSCLSLSVNIDDNFDSFCADFGYSNDSIIALKTYEAVKKENAELKKLFTETELEKLSEIQ